MEPAHGNAFFDIEKSAMKEVFHSVYKNVIGLDLVESATGFLDITPGLVKILDPVVKLAVRAVDLHVTVLTVHFFVNVWHWHLEPPFGITVSDSYTEFAD